MINYNTLTDKQKQRYSRIIQTAEDLMYQQGFYKLSLSELTHKLRVSRSTIYEYFGSKEGLVEKVVDGITKRLNNTLIKILENDELSIRDKFIHLANEQSNNQNANCYRLLSDLKIHTPHIYKQFEAARIERETNGYKLLVERGIEEEIFEPTLDKSFLLQLYLKMSQLLSETNLLDQISMTKTEAMTSIIKVFLNGTKRTQK